MTATVEEETRAESLLLKREAQRAAKVVAIDAINTALNGIDMGNLAEELEHSAVTVRGIVSTKAEADQVLELAAEQVDRVAKGYAEELEAAIAKLSAPLRTTKPKDEAAA